MRYIFAALFLFSACVQTQPNISVIDGDSVRFLGDNVRLMGFDTPETFRPKCDAERALGQQATAHLDRLIAGAGSKQLVYSRKKNGSLRRDKYRRLLGTLYIDGVDVAALQIQAGLARPYDGGKRAGWC